MAKFKNIGLAAKLIIAVLFCSIVIYLVVFGIGYSLTNRVIHENVEEIGDNVVKAAVNRVDAVVEEVLRITGFVNFTIQNHLNNSHEAFQMLETILKNNEGIFGISISYEPYLVDPKEKYFSPYCCRESSEIKCVMLGGDSYDYFNMDWYKNSKDTGQSLWTDPYTDEIVPDVYVLSHSAPFYKEADGKKIFQGIVSADISLGWLQEVISKAADNKYRGYAFLISRDGRFITFPKDGFALKKSIWDFPEYKQIATEMTAGKTGIVPLDDFTTGIRSWMFYEPVQSSNWSIGVVFEEDEILSSVLYIGHRMIALCIFGTLMLFIVIFFIARRITRPLNLLSSAAGLISHGDLNVKIPAVGRKDEVGTLARSLAGMQEDLKQYIAKLSRTITAQERISNELRIAHDIQQSIVPKEFAPMGRMKNVSAFGMLLPALEIGGDLYDCFEIDERHTCFVVGDVSDKGVHAAFIMAIVSTLLKGLSDHLKHPDHLLKIINREILERNSESMFVTLFCGILNNETGRFRYANAGHVPSVLMRRGAKPTFITGGTGMALGVDADAEFSWNSMMLSSGDKVFMYTDGVTDALDKDDNIFGETRLIDVLAMRADDDPERLVSGVMESVKGYSGGRPLPDDIALLCFSLTSCDPNRMNITVANDMCEIPKLAMLVGEFCASLGCEKGFVDELNLAIEEVVTNIVRFGYDDCGTHDVEISLVSSVEQLTITIVDDGRQLDPLQAAPPDTGLSLMERPIGGLGIAIVKKMVDVVSYERVGNFNKLTLIKKMGGGEHGRSR